MCISGEEHRGGQMFGMIGGFGNGGRKLLEEMFDGTAAARGVSRPLSRGCVTIDVLPVDSNGNAGGTYVLLTNLTADWST